MRRKVKSIQIDWKSRLKCDYCQTSPVTVAYKNLDGEMMIACKKHEPIVRETQDREGTL